MSSLWSNVRFGQWGKKMRGTFSCCPPKTKTAVTYAFFRRLGLSFSG